MFSSFPLSSPTLACFALLDDAQAQLPRSRLYTGLLNILTCHSAAEWPAFWQATQSALAQGQYALALLSYDTGVALQAITAHPSSEYAVPSRILIFSQCDWLDQSQVTAWLQAQIEAQSFSSSSPSGVANLRGSVNEQNEQNEQRFHEDIARVQAYIAAGDTYQVNYTTRLYGQLYGSAVALYQRLRERQPVPYGALICLPDGEAVLSLSPELFVRHHAGQLQAKPMKGTAAATGDAAQDAASAHALAHDAKNRAENLMIVDLLRNDLGRIAQPGSVKVSQLFEVERFSSVLQMTSSIEACLTPDADLETVLSALYPCGSITGAPKRRTMQIIRELEDTPRGLYTGAIGWFDPPAHGSAQTLGDFCLSVPIRTLHVQAPDACGERQVSMGVGAGIVFDSVAADEYAECQLKAKFLTGLPAEFDLFETIFATHAEGCRHLERHLARLSASAGYFGFALDQGKLMRTLQDVSANLPPHSPNSQNSPHRLRLVLRSDGDISLQQAPLAPLTLPAKVLLATASTRHDDLFLRHKTTWRSPYDHAWKTAEKHGAFDMLFVNEQGHLTEGGRSNVLVQLDGEWFTPPLSDGALPGVMRSVLLEDASLRLTERSLSLADLRRADSVMLCNALRGAFVVEVVWDAALDARATHPPA